MQIRANLRIREPPRFGSYVLPGYVDFGSASRVDKTLTTWWAAQVMLHVCAWSARARAVYCLRAVTSISIFIRGSARPAEIIMAAGRTSPKYFRMTGQQRSKSALSGKT